MKTSLHYIRKIEKLEDRERELAAKNKEKELYELKNQLERVNSKELPEKGSSHH